MNDVYLDHNATTPPDPAVVEAMLPYLSERFGNAASPHARGRAADHAIVQARERVAALVGVAPSRIVWTSGATEGINTVIKGLALANNGAGNLVYPATEHKAVIDTAEWCGRRLGVELRPLPVGRDGRVDLGRLREAIDDDTFLVAVMAANNETGVLNDVRTVAKMVRENGTALLCDATQQAGKLPLELTSLGVDFAVLSAHKLYGPQGIGALVTSEPAHHIPFEPLVHGGGHQGAIRSGTLNLAGIVGFGEACRIVEESLTRGEAERLTELRAELERQLEASVGPVTVHGREVPRLPNTTSVRIHGVAAEALVVNCSSIAMATGSACTSAVPAASHVLTAMGIGVEGADETVRLSIGRWTTNDEITLAVEAISDAASRIRGLAA